MKSVGPNIGRMPAGPSGSIRPTIACQPRSHTVACPNGTRNLLSAGKATFFQKHAAPSPAHAADRRAARLPGKTGLGAGCRGSDR